MSKVTAATPDIINLAFGTPPGMSPHSYLILHLTLTVAIGLVACTLTSRVLKLSNIPLSLLWSIYYVIGMIFHLCGWLSGDAQSYAFLGLASVHVYVEILLCVKVLESKHVDWWARKASLYFLIAGFVSMILWQPLNVFVLGSLLALPVDILVLPAAMAIMERAKDREVWWLGFLWSLNCPIICFLFGQLVWGAKSSNTHAALGGTLLQLQYIAMGIMWIRSFNQINQSRIGTSTMELDDCIEMGILPRSKHGGGSVAETQPLVASALQTPKAGMVPALKLTLAVLSVEFVLAVLLPLFLGRIDLHLMLSNACLSYQPGNVQLLANVGPNFIVPIDCAYLSH